MWVSVRAPLQLNSRLGALAGVVCGCTLIAKGLGGLDVAAPAFGPWPAVAGNDAPPQPLALPAAPAAAARLIVRPVRHSGVKRTAGGPQPPSPRAALPGDEVGRRPPAAGHPRRNAPGGAAPQERPRPLPAASTVTAPIAGAPAPASSPPAAVPPAPPAAAVAPPDAVAAAVSADDGGSAAGAGDAPPRGHAYGREEGAGNARGHRH